MTYVLWLDDYRPAPGNVRALAQNFVHAKHLDDFIWAIQEYGCPEFISFDHDLGDQHYGNDYTDEKTGYDCARWFASWVAEDATRLIAGFSYAVHSMNPVGAARIKLFMDEFLERVADGTLGDLRPYETE